MYINGYVPTTLGSLYVQSLGIMVATGRGDKRIASNLIEAVNFGDGYHAAFDTETGRDTSTDQYVGNIAWFLLALCHYGKRFDISYAETANTLADWIVGFYDNGAISAGRKGNGDLINTIVTEAQIDAIAALRAHAEVYSGSYAVIASTAEDYLFNNLVYGNRFAAGITDGQQDTTFYLDTTLWTALMLPEGDRLSWVRSNLDATDSLITTVDASIGPKSIEGWKDFGNKARIFVEAYAYFALYHHRLGNSSSYLSCLKQMRKFAASSQLSGYGIVLHSHNPDWQGADVSLSSESTLWFLLAQQMINPFRP